MDALISLLLALTAIGVIVFAGGLFWFLHVRPRVRRRYERNHQRRKLRHG